MRDESPIQCDEDMGLMLKARDGDHLAYDRVYSRYFRTVVSFLSRHHAQRHACEDLAQEVFARVWYCRRQYRPLAPVKHYLLGMAANVLHESRAKASHPVSMNSHDLETVVDTSRPSPPSQAQSAEGLQAIRALMASMPARQRQAVELVYLVGLAPDEAARRLGCSVKTLHTHLCSARQAIRKHVRPP